MANAVGAPPVNVSSKGAAIWLTIELIALSTTLVVIVGFFVAPDLTLKCLWKLIIPLVPASLLVSPMLWRNVCPLATLNKLPLGPNGSGQISRIALGRLAVLGMVLLGVLVTLRHVLFNGYNATDGTVLGITVIAVALVALVMGQIFERKTGFCNSFCPVLPVERLYGQSPLLEVKHSRCGDCNRCTTGCIDQDARMAIPLVLGKVASERGWMFSAYGVFAAAFPGFVLGYFLASDGALSSTAHVFLRVGQWTLASLLVVGFFAWVTKASVARMLPVLGAAAAGIYYWFSGPIVSGALGFEAERAAGGVTPAAVAIRAAAFALIAFWLWNAYARRPAEGVSSVPANS